MRDYPSRVQTVYYFGTCLVDAVYPQAGMAGIRLLQREGIRVIFPQDQSCCGQPAYNSGFIDEARAVARSQLAIFPKPCPIVVPSGSCAGMMRRHYPSLFKGEPEYEAVLAFSERIFELSEFLVHVLEVRLKDQGAPVKVTWHSSCHAMREMEVIEDSKSLIRQLENVTLVPLSYEHECCGFGGTFSIKQPAISEAMVTSKVDDIAATGAAKVITGDCGCLMNITGHMAFRGLPVTGQHLADFLWERTNA